MYLQSKQALTGLRLRVPDPGGHGVGRLMSTARG